MVHPHWLWALKRWLVSLYQKQKTTLHQWSAVLGRWLGSANSLNHVASLARPLDRLRHANAIELGLMIQAVSEISEKPRNHDSNIHRSSTWVLSPLGRNHHLRLVLIVVVVSIFLFLSLPRPFFLIFVPFSVPLLLLLSWALMTNRLFSNSLAKNQGILFPRGGRPPSAAFPSLRGRT